MSVDDPTPTPEPLTINAFRWAVECINTFPEQDVSEALLEAGYEDHERQVRDLLGALVNLRGAYAALAARNAENSAAIGRVLDWCDEQDGISKGPSPTTIAVHKAVLG